MPGVRLKVPHYSLQRQDYPDRASYDHPIHQAWTIGRVRFIQTDLRSEAVPGNYTMDPRQEQWLYRELAQSEKYALMVWISTKPWVIDQQ